ncbi:MAG: Rne/Rng family ribonuclease [Candidatus Omnitrophica bacterium]|nr:Rne/Rng family ribonuclease [Candidatus Omnitrophota bacterium]
MTREIIINMEEEETRAAVLVSGVLDEIFVERKDSRGIVGNIYKGRVDAVLPGMQAAFVNIGVEKNGFLYVGDVAEEAGTMEEHMGETLVNPVVVGSLVEKGGPRRRVKIEEILKKDQEILVQVVKDPIGTKGPRLTTYISLAGRLMVLMPTVDHVGVSRRIDNAKERERLKSLIKNIKSPDVGLIVRTAGEGKDRSEFLQDIHYLTNLWTKTKKESERKKAPFCAYQELDLPYRVLRDAFNSDIKKIVVDSQAGFTDISRFLDIIRPDLKNRLTFFDNPTPIFDSFKIEKTIKKLLWKKAWLKSGGYLLIEEGDALISIDVNTGRFVGRGGSLEETVFKTNIEAAREIPRQLRLRDLGGLIIVDFIDMISQKNRRLVLNTLRSELSKDKAKTTTLKISELGLVEMTRQRTRQSLLKTLCSECPHCRGEGYIPSHFTVSMDALRKLKRVCLRTNERYLIIKANSSLAAYLAEKMRTKINILGKKYHKKINIGEDPYLGLEEIKVFSSTTGKSLDPVER